MRFLLSLDIFMITLYVTFTEEYKPCFEISRDLNFPCKCSLGPVEEELDGNPSIKINCDRVVFANEFPVFPYGAPITSLRQREAGHQILPAQIFSSVRLPLRSLDFSGNLLRRLTEKVFQGLKSSLLELRLADNLLGDTLNPIFSSTEFHGLSQLRYLDLSGNSIKSIEEGILEGCTHLEKLYLDRNSLTFIPSASLNGPKSLKILSLSKNRIGAIRSLAFQAQQNLDFIDLSQNLIAIIESGAFDALHKLKELSLSHNRLTKFNSDVFQGAENLQKLDISENFIAEFPSVALAIFSDLKHLNLSSNLIQTLGNNDLASLTHLHYLDLSRNNIANIAPGTFLGLKQLRKLDISVNSLRTIEDDAFEGLDNLETLSLRDNNILLIPASALGRLPRLTFLELDYNRVAALSVDIFKSIANQVTKLVISKNVVRELPAATFQDFQKLTHLDLTRNLITTLNSDAFSGLDNILVDLYLSQNKISTLSGPPLSLNKLRTLDLSSNQLKELPRNVFSALPSLQHLNLSYNVHLSRMHNTLLHSLPKLKSLDLSQVNLKTLSTDLLRKLVDIEEIYLNNNEIGEVPEEAFIGFRNLSIINLSHNKIQNIRPASFVNLMNIKVMLLQNNNLNSFKGELFNTGTSLEVLNLSDNQISYLFPSSFRIHPRLKEIYVARNKLNFFPAELIATLQYLEYIDLSGNELKTVEELDFARLPRLRTLMLANNQIEMISEMAFHNSTQLQVLDFSNNRLERLGERLFEGLIRLASLNLERNMLSDLPELIFDRAKFQMLEDINLARNLFKNAPLKALQKQYFFINSVDLSNNLIKDIPPDDSIMVNIKNLDISFNPLSEESVRNILSEPKTARYLNLAGTGIKSLIQLETPFLKYLNLSHNNVSSMPEKIFKRTTLLEVLDLSHNNISNLTSLSRTWPLLKNIQALNISFNPIIMIKQNDFEGLGSVRRLSLHHLNHCTRIEKNAFKFVPNLLFLEAYDYPKLGYLDVSGVLKYLPSLKNVNIETKDAAIGSDQLFSVLHPRINELGIRGSRLRSVSSGTLSGLKGSKVVIRLKNTSVTSLPPALFFSVPRSSHVTLDVTGSQITTLSPQILVTLDDRRGDLKIVGLETNPIICDCSARALRRWLPSYMAMIKCSGPEHMSGRLLIETADDELTCDTHKITSTTQTTPTSTAISRTSRIVPKITEPEIIWSLPPTEKPNSGVKTLNNVGQSSVNNDDTLIIGIVGGVVSFIIILIIIICIIRLRMTNSPSQNRPLGNGNSMMGAGVVGTGSSCACSVKGNSPLYTVPSSAYSQSYSATLPHKMQNLSTLPSYRPNYSSMGRISYYQNGGQPYYIAYSSDDKIYR